MKKYTKVLALALALTMLLSMNVFAATIKEVAKIDEEDTKVEILEQGALNGKTQFGLTYKGENGDMYLLMVLDDKYDPEGSEPLSASDILYVNQATVEGGKATFSTIYPKDITQSKIYMAGGDLGELVPIATITPNGPVVNVEIKDTSSSIECQLSGDNKSMTVTNTKGACAIAYTTDGGVTYKRLAATPNGAGGYTFDITDVPVGATIVAAVKGETNGDGVMNLADYMTLKRSLLPTTHPAFAAIDAMTSALADTNGDGIMNLADSMTFKRSLLPTTHPAYQQLGW